MTADIHFSPLALTHALPFLPLAQGDIDYQVDRRSEPGLIDELLAEPTTKVVLTRGGLVAVPRGQGELVDYENVKMRLATLPGAYVSAALARYPEAVAMFLGSDVGARGESVVAVDITRVPEAGVPGVGGIAGVGGAVGGVCDARTLDAREVDAEAITAFEGVDFEGASVTHLLDDGCEGQVLVLLVEALGVVHRPLDNTRRVGMAPHAETVVARSDLQGEQVVVERLVSLVISLHANRNHSI